MAEQVLVDYGEGAKEVDGIALFVRVGNELSVEILVAGKANAISLLVFLLCTYKYSISKEKLQMLYIRVKCVHIINQHSTNSF